MDDAHMKIRVNVRINIVDQFVPPHHPTRRLQISRTVLQRFSLSLMPTEIVTYHLLEFHSSKRFGHSIYVQRACFHELNTTTIKNLPCELRNSTTILRHSCSFARNVTNLRGLLGSITSWVQMNRDSKCSGAAM